MFLASAQMQRAKAANLSAMNAEVGNSHAAALFDAHAQMVDEFATELRHGVRGKVLP